MEAFSDTAAWMWILGAIVTLLLMVGIVRRTRPPKRDFEEKRDQ